MELSVKDRRAGQNNSRGRRWREVFLGALEVVVRLAYRERSVCRTERKADVGEVVIYCSRPFWFFLWQ